MIKINSTYLNMMMYSCFFLFDYDGDDGDDGGCDNEGDDGGCDSEGDDEDDGNNDDDDDGEVALR